MKQSPPEQLTLFPPPATRAVLAQEASQPAEQGISTEARAEAHSAADESDRQSWDRLSDFVAGRW